jgi:hypothetical protein
LVPWRLAFLVHHLYRWASSVPLTDSDDVLQVNWCELSISNSHYGLERGIYPASAFAILNASGPIHFSLSPVKAV